MIKDELSCAEKEAIIKGIRNGASLKHIMADPGRVSALIASGYGYACYGCDKHFYLSNKALDEIVKILEKGFSTK